MEKCKYAKYCGGCTLQGISYSSQLKRKQEYIESLLSSFGRVNNIIGMDNPNNYRNKVQVTFGKDEHNKIICGNYMPSSHMIVPINDCMICDEKAITIINSIKKLIEKYHISVFDERVYKGCIRHILIRTSNTNEVMVVLVTGSFNIVKKDLFIKDILKFNPSITTIVQNINNKRTPMILGDKNITLYGRGYIDDELCGYKFKISPNSFYQVNKRQTEVLYNTALNMANFKGNETLIDAYCGTGTIGMIASNKVKEVIGVELNSQAIKDAITNKKINKVKNIDFINDDAGRFMHSLATHKTKIDALIMDPPRAGADFKFLNSVYKLKPSKVIYISCGPESLKNNLLDMTKHGYHVEYIQPVDMFPYTNHVETCVLLVRECSHDDEMVSIKVDMDGISLKQGEYKPDEKPTYGNIKKWVKEKYGFNVTSLYIGQIKDKVGIKERKNYNIGSGDGKVPNCPPEKEEAIMDAFRHFGLI